MQRFDPKDIPIKSDFEISPEDLDALRNLAWRHNLFDLEGEYINGDGEISKVAFIHVKKKIPQPLEEQSLTEIVQFPSGEEISEKLFILLEDENRRIDGCKVVKGHNKSSWIYGAIVQDENGDTWIAGFDDPTKVTDLTGDEPILMRISSETLPQVERENGKLIENLPAEGEFMLSDAELPLVVGIPWWGPLAITPEGHDAKIVNRDSQVHARIQERIAAELGNQPAMAKM